MYSEMSHVFAKKMRQTSLSHNINCPLFWGSRRMLMVTVWHSCHGTNSNITELHQIYQEEGSNIDRHHLLAPQQKIWILTKQIKMTSKEVTAKSDKDATAKPGKGTATTAITYKQQAKDNSITYTVTKVLLQFTSLLLGLQQYLTILGVTVLIPLILTPEMGVNGLQTAEVISSIFFVSGINTVRFSSHYAIRIALSWALY